MTVTNGARLFAQRAISSLQRANFTSQNLIFRMQMRMANSGTYYDSQSGQHVPIHDENKIYGYLLGNNKDSIKSPKDIVQTARSVGLHGCLLPPIVPQKRDVIDTAVGDVWFLHLPSTLQDRLSCDEVIEGNRSMECVNLCFEFSIEDETVDKLSTIIQKAMKDYGSRTSIGIFHEKCFQEDPILVASQIANIIDTTGGCSHLLVSPDNSVDPDDLRTLCEELSYLDVPGPTVKSRLMVESINEEQVEECLQMGISKFLLQDDDGDSLDMLKNAVDLAGKELNLRKSSIN